MPIYNQVIPVPDLRSPEEKVSKRCNRKMWVTLEALEASFELPDAQRPQTTNEKVRSLAKRYSEDPIVPGTIHTAVVDGVIYLFDGQHRSFVAFKLARELYGVEKLLVSVEFNFLDSKSDIGRYYVEENGCLVRQRPDDILNGLATPPLKKIQECKIVTTKKVSSQKAKTNFLSLSAAIRAWYGSAWDVPSNTAGMPAVEIANTMPMEDAEALKGFLECAVKAWGNSPSFRGLYGNFNLNLCAWLYRRTVLNPIEGVTALTDEQFTAGLVGLSANSKYLTFLVRRTLDPINRQVGYDHICKMFTISIKSHYKFRTPFRLPKPVWPRLETRSAARY